MQEGTIAFLQMVKVAAAITDQRPQACRTWCTYGIRPRAGFFASWGSLGHVTAAEPGALNRFPRPAGPRGPVRQPFPPASRPAEHLSAHGIVDVVVPSG